jgi:CRP-like cAMP-binding protein
MTVTGPTGLLKSATVLILAEAVLGRRVHPRRQKPRPTGRDTFVHAIEPGPTSNKLLAGLTRTDFTLLQPHLTTIGLAQGTVLCETGDEVGHVHFPFSGMISLVVVMRDGKAIETATVGREGVFGAMSGLGIHHSQVRAIVQLPMFASRIASTQLRKAATSSKPIADLCIRYNETLLQQARVTAACNALHSVEARVCRWLLQTRDRAESETLKLTQEFLSEMLGVRRTSVNEVAVKIQAGGAISYSRGVIKILDLDALKAVSCECYETLREENSD